LIIIDISDYIAIIAIRLFTLADITLRH